MRRLLVLDDTPSRHEEAARVLTRCTMVHCTTPEDFSSALSVWKSFDVMLLDHDLGVSKTGLDCVRDNLGQFANAYVIVHSVNKPGADSMLALLRSANIPCEHIPFTSANLWRTLLAAGL